LSSIPLGIHELRGRGGNRRGIVFGICGKVQVRIKNAIWWELYKNSVVEIGFEDENKDIKMSYNKIEPTMGYY